MTVTALAGMTALNGQEIPVAGRLFQVFGTPNNYYATLDEGFSNQVVRGKPFSATEERHFVQVLSDGTRVETNQVSRLYRDSQGRTRMEDMSDRAKPQPGFEFGPITIYDLVAGIRVALNPSARTALSVPAVAGLRTQRVTIQAKGAAAETTENLRPQMVNGVMAQGVRTVMTIPRGQIGNDREFKVVTERWVSNDLQMLIKSTNSDPRFGDTTYQLTGITEWEPDASLFQVPAGYTTANGGGRGGGARSGGPAVTPIPPVGPGARSGLKSKSKQP